MSETKEPSPEVLQKLATAKEKKDAGDQAFKAGEVKNGTDSPLLARRARPTPPPAHRTRAWLDIHTLFSPRSAQVVPRGDRSLSPLRPHGLTRSATYTQGSDVPERHRQVSVRESCLLWGHGGASC